LIFPKIQIPTLPKIIILYLGVFLQKKDPAAKPGHQEGYMSYLGNQSKKLTETSGKWRLAR